MSTIRFICNHCHQGECHENHLGNAFVCDRCKSTYPLLAGVIDFVPDRHDSPSLAQRAMEWKPLVSVYESRLWRRNPLFERLAHISFKDEAEAIIEAAELKGKETVLDLACGTGNYSRIFASAVNSGEVIAVDLSRPMLEFAVNKARQQGLQNVRFIRGNALEIPLPDDSFDVVNCCGALHLFSDVDAVLSEIQRVLKPGGRFTTAVFRQQKGRYSPWLEALSRTVLGIELFSFKGMVKHLQEVGFIHHKAFHDKGRWLIMQSIKL